MKQKRIRINLEDADGAKFKFDIEVTFGGRSREHVSRLMKKLFRDGYVDRNTASRPYAYMITEKGRERVSSKEGVVYAVSQ